ncbi:hypothetical protein JOL62DRAFT_560482 [Phyllosticta paracitricarpa]|uniref:Uncharacterized protein n=1 Tax=Phyllosticta paracitricarpa TaxID=2016321 RepID=A0ABR1MSY2_9PEZI
MAPLSTPRKISYADYIAKANPNAQSPSSPEPASPTPRRRGAKAGRGLRYQPFDYTAVETPPKEQPSQEASTNQDVAVDNERQPAAESHDDQHQRPPSSSPVATPERQGQDHDQLTSPGRQERVQPTSPDCQERIQPCLPLQRHLTAVEHDTTATQGQQRQPTPKNDTQPEPNHQQPQVTVEKIDQAEPRDQQPQDDPFDNTPTQPARQRNWRRHRQPHNQAAQQNHQPLTSVDHDYQQGFQQTLNQPANLNQAFNAGQLQQYPVPQSYSNHTVLPTPSLFPTAEAHIYSQLYGGYFSRQDLRYINHVFDTHVFETMSQQNFHARNNMAFNSANNPTNPPSAPAAAPPAINDAASTASDESMDKYAWARGMVARERARERAEEEERRQAEATPFMQSTAPNVHASQVHSRQTSGNYNSGPQQTQPSFGPHPDFASPPSAPSMNAMSSATYTPINYMSTATSTKHRTISLAPNVPATNETWPMFRKALVERLETLQKEAQDFEDRVCRSKEQSAAMGQQQQQQQQQHKRNKSSETSIASSMQQLTLADVATGKVDISQRELMSFTDEELFGRFGFRAPGPQQIQDLYNRYRALLAEQQQQQQLVAGFVPAAASVSAPAIPGPGLGFGMEAPAAAAAAAARSPPAAGPADQHFLADTYSAHGGPKLPAEHVSRRLWAPRSPAATTTTTTKSSSEANKPASSSLSSAVAAPGRKKETFVPGRSGACFGAFDRSVWNGRQLPRELRRGGEKEEEEEEEERKKKEEEKMGGFLPGLGFDQV